MIHAFSFSEVGAGEPGQCVVGQTFHGLFRIRLLEAQIQRHMIHADLLQRCQIRAKMVRAQSESQMDRLRRGPRIFGQIDI